MTQSLNIYPFKTGLDNDLEPWLLPPDAFTELDNFHVKHGYIEKREGYIFFGSLPDSRRVMGIYQYLDSTGGKTTFAFDDKSIFRFVNASNSFTSVDSNVFTSSETNYIWAVNWQANPGITSIPNRLYFTNGKAVDDPTAASTDGIQYIDSATAATSNYLNPVLGGTGANTRYLWGGKLLFTIGQRLIVLNTYEGKNSAANFPQRARWSAKLNHSNWNDIIAGGGGYSDAATGDQIITAGVIQNQLVVFFTDSVWSLIPTSDPNRAFNWQRLNNFRASFGKMAITEYDRYVVTLGDRGIAATDGVQTRRIDDRIQDFTVDEINISNSGKIFCKRSYSNRRFWTLYSSKTQDENNKALIYDDDSSAFSTYDISLNCLGYGNKNMDYSFDDFTVANDLDLDFDNFGEEDFQSYFAQENSNVFLGGDISGNIYILETSGRDNQSAISSRFFTAAWNPFKDSDIECKMPYIDFYINTDKTATATIQFFKNTESTYYRVEKLDFLPNLDYVTSINNVSQENPANINAPNHGLSTGDIIYIYGVIGMENINNGSSYNSYTITYVDEDNFTLDGVDSTGFDAYDSGGGIYRREFYQTKVWKRIYAGGSGFQHRLKLETKGAEESFRIYSMKPTFIPTSGRLIS